MPNATPHATPPQIYYSKILYHSTLATSAQIFYIIFKTSNFFRILLLSKNNFFVKENDLKKISRQYTNFQNEIFKVN
jgi:hypothetical protein